METFHTFNTVGLSTFQKDLDYFLEQEKTQELYEAGDNDDALYEKLYKKWCDWISSDGQAGYPIL